MASWYRVDMSAFRMDFVMVAALIFFALVSASPLNAWSLFGSQQLTPEEKIHQLQQQQVDHPDDPVVNYNLGVALYRINRLQEAQSNFERTLAHIKSHNKLEKQALFNKANTELKLTVNMLPTHWEEQKDLDQQIVSEALKTINQAIQEYQKLLDLEPKNIKAQINKKYTEEIKKKLEEKKKQQQQQNKKDKQNDKQEKSHDNKQDQQKDKQQDQDKQQKKDQGEQKQEQQKEQRNEQNDQKQQQGDQQKQEQSQQQNAQPEQQQAGSEQAQAAQKKQPQESSEERRMRALLENLQSDETERQKALVRQNITKQQPPQQGQKPW
jgi:septal ring factor EnvC (AmiA/AmiB activator)